MIDVYNQLLKELNSFVSDSKYEPFVVKNYTSASTHFPIISCSLSNFTDTDFCTIDMIEQHQEIYLTIDIYTKSKIIDNEEFASQAINDELTELVMKFFSSKKMKMTLCRLTPNADKNIMRRTIQYQGLVSLARGNIIRRWNYV